MKISRTSRFLLLTPIVILFTSAIFMRTVNRMIPTVASIPASFNGLPEPDAQWGEYEGKVVEAPVIDLASDKLAQKVLGVASPNDKWIEVDLSEQKLRAWDGNSLFLETLVSSGLPYFPTPQGEFRIWVKLRATRMSGGEGRYAYDLPNVPYVMYFSNDKVPSWRGYGLHGTYWHNDFGTVRSHGCVNLPTPVAEKLYYWATPTLPEGKTSVFADSSNIGTKIVIHE